MKSWKRCKTGRREYICSELPIDVILVILLRLPVVSLLRLRSVSKSWLSLLSDPDFSKTHQQMNNRMRILLSSKFLHHSFLSCFLSTKTINPPLPLKNPTCTTTIIGSLDGLICLFLTFSDTNKQIVVWNPATKKRKILPNFRVPFLNLSKCAFGFYFDQSINNYKVVGIFADICTIIVKVYSFLTRRWKRIKLKNTYGFRIQSVLPSFYKSQPAPFRNGKFYWFYYKGTTTMVTCFDVENDIFMETILEVPNEPERYSLFYQKLVLCLQNQIHVLRICVEYTTVWMLKETELVWTRLCLIDHATMDRPDHYLYYSNCDFFVLNTGEIVLFTGTKFKMGTKFTIYNPKDGSIRYSEFKTPVPVAACTYVETLTSI